MQASTQNATSKAYATQIEKFKLEQAGLTAGFDITLPIFTQAYVMKTANPSSKQYQAEYDAAKATLDAILQDTRKLSDSVKTAKSSADVIISQLDKKNNQLKEQIASTNSKLTRATSSDNAMIPRYDDYMLKVYGGYANIVIQLILLIVIVYGVYRVAGGRGAGSSAGEGLSTGLGAGLEQLGNFGARISTEE
jgi:hypothetical protein